MNEYEQRRLKCCGRLFYDTKSESLFECGRDGVCQQCYKRWQLAWADSAS